MVSASTCSLLLEHSQMSDLYADVSLKQLHLHICHCSLDLYCLRLFDVFKAFWLAELKVCGVLVSLNDKLVVCSHHLRNQVADDVFEELEFCPTFLAELRYVMSYELNICCSIALMLNCYRLFEGYHSCISQ